MRPAFRVGALLNQTAEAAREEAVALASKSDVAVVVVGTNGDWESEGYDRKDINIPGESNALVEAVLKANPRTIVVTQSGMPLAMPWVDSAPTLVQAMFGGNEVGNGLADVLFGKVAPSGKLPMTFPCVISRAAHTSKELTGVQSPLRGQPRVQQLRHYHSVAWQGHLRRG